MSRQYFHNPGHYLAPVSCPLAGVFVGLPAYLPSKGLCGKAPLYLRWLNSGCYAPQAARLLFRRLILKSLTGFGFVPISTLYGELQARIVDAEPQARIGKRLAVGFVYLSHRKRQQAS